MTRGPRIPSLGWTRAGEVIIALALRGLVPYCPSCGEEKNPKSRAVCHRAKVCTDPFYERHYRAWHITERVVDREVREGKRMSGCAKCGDKGEWDGVSTEYHPLEYDHVVEIARGGDPYDPANVQLLCHRCHQRKTARFARLGKLARHARPTRLVPLESFA